MGTAGGKWTYPWRFGLEPPAVILASIISSTSHFSPPTNSLSHSLSMELDQSSFPHYI